MAPHSSTLAWKIPWTEERGLQSMGSLESDTTEWFHFHFSLPCIGEGNGNPLQCSCLENPRDAGAWWAAIYGVAHDWSDAAAAAACFNPVFTTGRMQGAETGGADKFKSYTVHSNSLMLLKNQKSWLFDSGKSNSCSLHCASQRLP